MTDDVDEERDRKIADHVLRMHRYLPAGVEEGTPVRDILSQPLAIEGPGVAPADPDYGGAGAGGAVETTPFEKYDPLLHVGFTAAKSRTRRGKQVKVEIVSIAFIKKYIQYAKSRPVPVLTNGASNHIVNVYANLRNEDEGQTNRKKVALFSVDYRLPLIYCTADIDCTINGTNTRNSHPSFDSTC